MSQTRRSRFVRQHKQPRRSSEALRSTRRWSSVERLEDRQLLNADYNPWHNYSVEEDVNGDTYVTAYDALMLINELNAGGSRRLGDLLASNMSLDGSAEGESPAASAAKFDVTGDFDPTPADALGVINHLNAEGEGPNGELCGQGARRSGSGPAGEAGLRGGGHALGCHHHDSGR